MIEDSEQVTQVRRRIDWWNLFFIFFFVYLMYLGFRLVEASSGALATISVWDTIIMALAIFRLTRLAVYDSITQWIRDLFEDGAPRTFLGTIKTLINCPWCAGLWFALVVVVAYVTSPFLWFFIFVLALSGLATFMQLLTNFVGWSAEYKKQQVRNNK
ncbi:MAG: DUF1360 domain-containing protein [Patescibacteria group bacterium UBA2163]